MNPNYTTRPVLIADQTQAQRVLRNTYWLLALSMVPTVLGAWAGLALGLDKTSSPLLSFLVFFGGAMGFMYAIEKTKNSATGVPVLLGFTFFMGLMLSRLIGFVLGLANGAELITTAFAGTGAVFLGMAVLSTVVKRELGGLGKFLFIGMILMIVASVANIFLHSSALMLTVSTIGVGIFSAFILYDLKAVRDGQVTNYIEATLHVYLSLINLFQNLLTLLTLLSGRDR